MGSSTCASDNFIEFMHSMLRKFAVEVLVVHLKKHDNVCILDRLRTDLPEEGCWGVGSSLFCPCIVKFCT